MRKWMTIGESLGRFRENLACHMTVKVSWHKIYTVDVAHKDFGWQQRSSQNSD